MFLTNNPSIELGALTLICIVLFIVIFLKFHTLPTVGKSGNEIIMLPAEVSHK